MKRAPEFDYCVVNEDNKQIEAVRRIMCIVEAEHNKISQKPISL
jgi:guanylate kinase